MDRTTTEQVLELQVLEDPAGVRVEMRHVPTGVVIGALVPMDGRQVSVPAALPAELPVHLLDVAANHLAQQVLTESMAKLVVAVQEARGPYAAGMVAGEAIAQADAHYEVVRTALRTAVDGYFRRTGRRFV
jgi:hypothetical protein